MQKKTLRILVIAIAVAAIAAMTWLMAPLLRFVSDPELFRAWVDSYGLLGRLAYIGMVVLQVIVALIPGEPFEIAAGYAFGAVEGTILSTLACTLGSVIVFLLVRRYGMRVAGLFFSREKLESVRFLKTNPKREVLFLLIFMIPGTPKDLLCYYAGMTDLRFPVWLLICSFGRLPSIITSTIGGNALGTENYWFAAGVFAAALAISGIGILLYNYICSRNKGKEE
ncbi:MAG: TVP38/TMEM64 family protein [Ruminococcaceae bacterium]|nr:TVP38/TMEM64 family protein [Oscillospiraceae bacterium]